MNNQQPIIILGAGGHATVLAELLLACQMDIVGLVAPQALTLKNYPQIAYLGDDHFLQTHFPPESVWLINGLGGTSVASNVQRQRLFEDYQQRGYQFATVVHPSAIIASTVTLQEGVQVMAGAVLQANVTVAANSIINTRASIDHDCTIGHSVHIAPGAILCGNVTLEEGVHVGVGANLIQGITIAKHSMIKAGITVLRNTLKTAPIAIE